MTHEQPLWERLTSDSFLEYAFLRWVLAQAAVPGIARFVTPQREVVAAGHTYLLDYGIEGDELRLGIELDGFEFHSSRSAFTYDRLRANDIQAEGWALIRFSYDAIRWNTRRCVEQLRRALATDRRLQAFVDFDAAVAIPDFRPDPAFALAPSPLRRSTVPETFFDSARTAINPRTLRECQRQAYAALTAFYKDGGSRAACVMSVGAGKTALGVLAALTFARHRALIITPGSVIRGTFDRALDPTGIGNVLYNLPNGALIPGCRSPSVRTLDRETSAIRDVTRTDLLSADIIVTNFHSLGSGEDPDDLLGKLEPEDIDFVVVDEAHIAAADSYQRCFAHFAAARSLLMSACFQRLDGKPIDAEVVYRYRLIDSIADGNAKNIRVHRFAPDPEQTTYEMVWPDGGREEIRGRAALLEIVKDERKLSRIAARSDASIRAVVRAAREALDSQRELLSPIKPRALFSALGERHAEQIARIACEHGIPCGYLHHSMSDSRIRETRERFEQESGDLQGIVQLKMLGQGYDFPPITVVVPMRPYGSFSEFYQFIGRGIRVVQHPALAGRVGPGDQYLDVIYHAELGLDDHLDTVYRENDMDPITAREIPDTWRTGPGEEPIPGTRGTDVASRPDAFVLFEKGAIERRIVHDEERIEQRRTEREMEALAERYARYAQSTPNPVTFDQYVAIVRSRLD